MPDQKQLRLCRQLADALQGRILPEISVVDETEIMADELRSRGVSVSIISNYSSIFTPPGGGSRSLDCAKLKELISACETQLLLIVGDAETSSEAPKTDVPEVRTVKRREILAALEELGAEFSYKAALTGELGCYVVEGENE